MLDRPKLVDLAERALATARRRNLTIMTTGVVLCIAATRDGRKPLHVERKHGDIGREQVQEHAIADALVELIRCLEAD